MKSVELYKDKQLVLVTIDKNKEPTYTYYYLVGTETSLGPTAYLVEPKFLNNNLKEGFLLFLKYKPNKHIFYDAECFRNNPASKNLDLLTFEANSRAVNDSLRNSAILIAQGRNNEAETILNSLIKHKEIKNDVLMYRCQAYYQNGRLQ